MLQKIKIVVLAGIIFTALDVSTLTAQDLAAPVANTTQISARVEAVWTNSMWPAIILPGIKQQRIEIGLIPYSQDLDTNFLATLVGATNSGVNVFPMSAVETNDPDHLRLWFNATGDVIQTTSITYNIDAWIATNYGIMPSYVSDDPTNAAQWSADRSPDRILVTMSLIATNDVPVYLSNIAVAAGAEFDATGHPVFASALFSNKLAFVGQSSGLPASLYLHATNSVTTIGIFAATNLLAPAWNLLASIPHSSDPVMWSYSGPEQMDFFVLGNMTDSDTDGIPDAVEIYITHTDPNNPDTDGDGLTDGQEWEQYGTDPNAYSTAGGTLPDGWVVNNGLNPFVNNASADPDGDGLDNATEFAIGTDPHNYDEVCQRAVSFHIYSHGGNLWFGMNYVGAYQSSAYGHLSMMTQTTAVAASNGITSDLSYESDFAHYVNTIDSYATVWRSATNVISILVDHYLSWPYITDGELQLYRGHFSSSPYVAATEPGSSATLAVTGSNFVSWTCDLNASTYSGWVQIDVPWEPDAPNSNSAYITSIATTSGKAPPVGLPVNSQTQLVGRVLGNPSGTWHWVTSSGNLTLVNPNSKTVTVQCGSSASAATNAEKVYATFTSSIMTNNSCTVEYATTVFKLDLKSITFTSDHGVLTDYNSDFDGSGGTVYSPRGWVKGGANNPISHTRYTNVSINAVVSAQPAGMNLSLRGTGELPGLSFPKTGFVSTGSDQTVPLTSTLPLRRLVDIVDENISWSALFQDASSYSMGTSGPHRIYVTCGTPGPGPTLKRINFVCTKALSWGPESRAADSIWDAVASGTYFYTGNGQWDDWQLLDGWNVFQGGDCDNQARCMASAVGMLGIHPAIQTNVYASTNAGAGNCTAPDTRTCPVHGAEGLLLNFPSSGLNEYEGCCNAAGSFYAITPKKKAANDYEMLKKLGTEDGITQIWCFRNMFGDPVPCNQPGASVPIP